jgi:hypothetical protein
LLFLSDPRTRLVALLIAKKWIPQRLLNKDQTFDTSNSTNTTNQSNIPMNPNVTQPTLNPNENLNSADNLLQQLDDSLHNFQKLVETQGKLSATSSFDNLTLENKETRKID